MIKNDMKIAERDISSGDTAMQPDGSRKRGKKEYNAPSLSILGELATVTLGGSPGVGDSGNSSMQKFPV